MKQKFFLFLLTVCISGAVTAQNLKVFTATMKTDSLCYLSLKNNKAYTVSTVAAVKDEVDLGLFSTITDKNEVLEWYNLKTDNDKVPAPLTGTNTGVAAISFDRDQFDKCKTIADLSRMTGHMSRNSFSHFAVIRSSSNSYQRCFIAERSDKKRALIYVTINPGNSITTEVKTE